MRLRRTSPDQAGWTRRRAGSGFTYLDHAGGRLAEDQTQRIKDLVIPPATPALARSAYVDPRVVEAYERGLTIKSTTRRTYDSPDVRQAALERATLKLIKQMV